MPPAPNPYALLWPPAAWLVAGIHMAGPDLTPETFAHGPFRLRPAGGGPSTPQISYGNWGFFDEMDYAGIDDATEIWWDPSRPCRGRARPGRHGRLAPLPRRHPLHAARRPAPAPFTDAASTATVLNQLPPEDRAPAYPPPPGSPAAG